MSERVQKAASSGDSLGFRILGPLEVVHNGHQVRLGGPVPRTILATLLLSAGRVVSVDRLMTAAWQDGPPTTARNQIARGIWTLRRAFADVAGSADLIATTGPGYLLRPGPGQVDSWLAEQQVAQARSAAQAGRTSEAIQLFRSALELWRGPVLSDLDSPVISAGAQPWEELRLIVLEECVELELARGGGPELVFELATIVNEHPLRERPRAQLMQALHRAGRPADALQVYHEGRRLLVEELGLEPGPYLQQALHAILRGESVAVATIPESPAVAAVRPAQLPLRPLEFVGRQEAWARLDEVFSDPGEAPPVCVVSGPGGVGKTALAVAWAHEVAGRFDDGQLFADLHGHDPTREPTSPAAVLESFLRALGMVDGQIPPQLDERAALYRSILRDRRVLIVLDDASSAAQVEPLLPGTASCGVVITSRRQLGGLVAGVGARTVALDVLSADESTRLLCRIAGEDRIASDPATAARLVELCDRLPLALRIAAGRLATRPQLTLADLVTRLTDESGRLDELSIGELQLRASIATSYQRLSPPARIALRRLGLLSSSRFGLWTGAALLDAPLSDASRILEELVDAQLAQPAGQDPTGEPRYRLADPVHLYARERAAAEDPPVVGEAALARVFGCLLGRCDVAIGALLAPVPRICGDTPRWWPAAAPELPPTDPAGWLVEQLPELVAAVAQAAAAGLDEACWELALAAAVVSEAGGQLDTWRLAGERALAACRKAGNRRGEAALHYSLARLRAIRLPVGESPAPGQAIISNGCQPPCRAA